ncbi:MAG: phage baseplate assembly protein V [Nitrospirae bacterium]|nr:phage baseplate assembly protein V [Nitrospirota bacterium]
MIEGLVRVGTVTQTYPDRGTVKVQLTDVDDQVSYELQVVVRKTLKDKDYWMPDIDEHVVCLFLGQGLEQGFVLGAIYSDADSVPVSNNDKWHKKFEDGTIIEYDRAAHKLLTDVKGDIEVKVTGNVDIAVEGNTNITVNGNTTVRTEGHTDISSGACISFNCDLHGGGSI